MQRQVPVPINVIFEHTGTLGKNLKPRNSTDILLHILSVYVLAFDILAL